MKYLKQFMVIMIFSLIGEICNLLIPLPVPASIYGMLLLFLALLTGVVKLEQVEGAGSFCLAVMPVFFVGPTMKLMVDYKVVANVFVPYVIICVISTFVTLLSCGLTAQFVIRRQKKEKEESHE